jgi:hypothetical protein
MDTSKKCAHPSCNCTAVADSKYCSTYCEGQAETPDLVCNCGHAGCSDRRPTEAR